MINEVIEMTETNKQQEHRIKQHLAKIQHRIHEDRAKLDREEVILNRAKKRCSSAWWHSYAEGKYDGYCKILASTSDVNIQGKG